MDIQSVHASALELSGRLVYLAISKQRRTGRLFRRRDIYRPECVKQGQSIRRFDCEIASTNTSAASRDILEHPTQSKHGSFPCSDRVGCFNQSQASSRRANSLRPRMSNKKGTPRNRQISWGCLTDTKKIFWPGFIVFRFCLFKIHSISQGNYNILMPKP